MTYQPPIDDLLFALRHHAKLGELSNLPGLEEVSLDLASAVLEEAGKLAAEQLAPLNWPGNLEGATLVDGEVRTPDGFKEAYGRFVEGGWNALPFPEEIGGQNLPWALSLAVGEMWHSANFSFGLCPLLTQAAIDALIAHGSDHQKNIYLPKLASGVWTGTMCLTEPQAGSDVGALRTKAVRDGERYRITGTKIYITYGEHDWTENICHLVLARTPDAPAGTKGISLFLVPKFLPDQNGDPGERNDLRCVSLEKKLGIHASPTCVMSFGENEGAIGFLVGEECQGMRLMFTMMNNARIAVGLEGLSIAERAYQAALAYARERQQGRKNGASIAIIEHPDVRRHLTTMRAQIEAMRAMIVELGAEIDHAERAEDPERRRRAQARVDLMTPIVKAWCTDTACAVTSSAIQVHGGMGFIEETGVAQHFRDARIAPIYEGTNGIQALDLVGRKLRMANGQLPWQLFEELRGELRELERSSSDLVPPLRDALANLEAATRWMQADHGADDEAEAAGAAPYLSLFGATVAGFTLARSDLRAAATNDRLAGNKARLARFFAQQLLPPATALLPAITAGSWVLALEP